MKSNLNTWARITAAPILITAALSLIGLNQADAAIVLISDVQVTTGATVPTAADVVDSVYSNFAVATTPVVTRYDGSFRIFNTDTGTFIPATSIAAIQFTLGNSGAGSVVNVPYSGTFATVGSSSPQFSLHNNSKVDITAPVYGNPLIGTTLPSGATYVAVTNQVIPAGFAGGTYDPSSTKTQTGTFTVTLNYAGGTVSGSGVAMVGAAPVPEPNILALLPALGMVALRRKRSN